MVIEGCVAYHHTPQKWIQCLMLLPELTQTLQTAQADDVLELDDAVGLYK